MEDNFFDTLVRTTFTVKDAYHRLALARRFYEEVRFGGESRDTTLESFFVGNGIGEEVSGAFGVWDKAWNGSLNADSMHGQFEALRHRLSELPVMRLAVPIELATEECDSVGRWIRAHAHPHTMMEFLVDSRAVGGCRIVWQGRYGDFSFRYFYELHRRQIVEAIRIVLSRGKDSRANIPALTEKSQ